MSTFRRPFRIVVDGEPHEIVTSARDMATVTGDPQSLGGAMFTYAMLHAACMRLDVPGVPHDLDKFIDLLDDIDTLDGKPLGFTGTPDPTPPATSDG